MTRETAKQSSTTNAKSSRSASPVSPVSLVSPDVSVILRAASSLSYWSASIARFLAALAAGPALIWLLVTNHSHQFHSAHWIAGLLISATTVAIVMTRRFLTVRWGRAVSTAVVAVGFSSTSYLVALYVVIGQCQSFDCTSSSDPGTLAYSQAAAVAFCALVTVYLFAGLVSCLRFIRASFIALKA